MKSEYIRLAHQLDPMVLAMAVQIADESAANAVECHTILGEGAWRDTSGEPIGQDVKYLVARGLAELDETNPAILRLKSEKRMPPYPFCEHPDKCCATGRCERTVKGEPWSCAD